MKGLINFLEKNSKWIIRIFVVVGLFLILKLGYFGVYTTCGGGGYINLCIIPNFHYFWTNASFIALTFLLISLMGIILIKFTNNNLLKVLLVFMILFLGILSKPFFYYLSPDFKFYYTDQNLEYMDEDFKPKDIDLYLEYMGKYCNNNIDDFNFKNVNRDSMCGGKYLYDFETVQDYKKVFDFANKNNMKELYRVTFIGAEKIGLEKIIEGYKDDTFYGYIVKRTSKVDKLKLLLDNVNNKQLFSLIKYYIKKIEYFFNNSDSFNQDEGYKYWDDLSDEIYNNLKQIKTVNTKIF